MSIEVVTMLISIWSVVGVFLWLAWADDWHKESNLSSKPRWKTIVILIASGPMAQVAAIVYLTFLYGFIYPMNGFIKWLEDV